MEKHFQYWVASTAFSLVSLTSLTNSFDEESSKDWSREQRWVVSVTAVNLILSAISMFMHLGFKDFFAGTKPEMTMTTCVLAMWAAGLPTFMDGDNMFAVEGTEIINGNLFFSTWGGFIMAMMLMTSHLKRTWNREDDTTVLPWIGLGTASWIVMATTARFWKANCEDIEDNATCRRTVFGIVLALISIFIGFGQAWFKIQMVEQLLSVVVAIAWCFGVAYMTFDSGPATSIGTMYFATWAALFFVLIPASASVLALSENTSSTTTTEPAPTSTTEGKAEVDAKAGSDDKEEEEVETPKEEVAGEAEA